MRGQSGSSRREGLNPAEWDWGKPSRVVQRPPVLPSSFPALPSPPQLCRWDLVFIDKGRDRPMPWPRSLLSGAAGVEGPHGWIQRPGAWIWGSPACCSPGTVVVCPTLLPQGLASFQEEVGATKSQEAGVCRLPLRGPRGGTEIPAWEGGCDLGYKGLRD